VVSPHRQARELSGGGAEAAASELRLPQDVKLTEAGKFRSSARASNGSTPAEGERQCALRASKCACLTCCSGARPAAGARRQGAELRYSKSRAMRASGRWLQTSSGIAVGRDVLGQVRARRATRGDHVGDDGSNAGRSTTHGNMHGCNTPPRGQSAARTATYDAANQVAARVRGRPTSIRALIGKPTLEPAELHGGRHAQGCDHLQCRRQIQQVAQLAPRRKRGLKPEQVRVHTDLPEGALDEARRGLIHAAVEATIGVGQAGEALWNELRTTPRTTLPPRRPSTPWLARSTTAAGTPRMEAALVGPAITAAHVTGRVVERA